MLEPGKRYWWTVCGIRRTAIFTGRYDRRGNAILKGKKGTWNVPVDSLNPVIKKKRR